MAHWLAYVTLAKEPRVAFSLHLGGSQPPITQLPEDPTPLASAGTRMHVNTHTERGGEGERCVCTHRAENGTWCSL